jgi:glycosyltransferase involved in cell wall biosynthesis
MNSPISSLGLTQLEISPISPKVSVVIATYNRLEYLHDALISVLNQSFRDFEVIISDDASQVDIKGMIYEFNDSRIRYYRHEKNLGMGGNKAFALAQAKGEFVASLDDDDMWEPTYLSTLIPIMTDNPDIIMAACDHYIVDENGTIDPQLSQENTKRWKRDQLEEGIHKPFQKSALIDSSFCIASAAIIRRNMVPWHELHSVGVYWDKYLAYLICREGMGLYYCSNYLVKYRVHEKSETAISGSRDIQAKIRKGQSDVTCHTAFLNDDRLAEFHPIFQERLAHAQVTLGIGLLRDGKVREARSYIQKSFSNALSLRSTISFLLTLIPHQYSEGILRRLSKS